MTPRQTGSRADARRERTFVMKVATYALDLDRARGHAPVMSFEPKQVCSAITAVIVWGPEMRHSPEERLAVALPELTAEAIAALVAEAKRIEHEAYALAEQAYDGLGFDLRSGREELGRRFPEIDRTTLDELWRKGTYYAWHG